MGMRPSDKTMSTSREVEKHHETAHRALALHAVTKWNDLMERNEPRHKPFWSPMVGAAIPARFYFLNALRLIDLRLANEIRPQ